jgi:hypothetical protein
MTATWEFLARVVGGLILSHGDDSGSRCRRGSRSGRRSSSRSRATRRFRPRSASRTTGSPRLAGLAALVPRVLEEEQVLLSRRSCERREASRRRLKRRPPATGRARRGRRPVGTVRPGGPGPPAPYGVRSPRAGRCRTVRAHPVTSPSSHAPAQCPRFGRESDRNASCARADRAHTGAWTRPTRRRVPRTTHHLGMSCEASPQISAPALVGTHQRQLTATSKLFGMPRNRNTGAPRLVAIT